MYSNVQSGFSTSEPLSTSSTTATVDGETVPIRRGNVAFRAVPVPAGVHEVEFRYESDTVSIGMLVSTVGWVAWCLFVANELRLLRRRHTADTAHTSTAVDLG